MGSVSPSPIDAPSPPAVQRTDRPTSWNGSDPVSLFTAPRVDPHSVWERLVGNPLMRGELSEHTDLCRHCWLRPMLDDGHLLCDGCRLVKEIVGLPDDRAAARFATCGEFGIPLHTMLRYRFYQAGALDPKGRFTTELLTVDADHALTTEIPPGYPIAPPPFGRWLAWPPGAPTPETIVRIRTWYPRADAFLSVWWDPREGQRSEFHGSGAPSRSTTMKALALLAPVCRPGRHRGSVTTMDDDEFARRMPAQYGTLRRRFGRKPTRDELARELGLSLGTFKNRLAVYRATGHPWPPRAYTPRADRLRTDY